MPVEKHELQSFTPSTGLGTVPYSGNPGTPDSKPSPSFAPNLVARRRPQRSILGSAAHLLKSLVLPIVATAYLAFCYTVHHRVVPVGVDALVTDSPKRLGFVKAGITSISILIITLGLFPLSSLLQDLKSEEFFRALSSRRSGIPLSTINAISIPSFGTYDSAVAIVRSRCSPYFTAAFFAGFLSIAVSTLAPAALTVDTVLSDGEIVAFAVGAVLPDTVYNTSDYALAVFGTNSIIDNSEQAASVAWAETALGVQYSFTSQGDLDSGIPPYIIPTPAELPTSTSARWLTDVIALQPSCVWSKTNISQPITLKGNFSSNFNDFAVNLPEINTTVVMSPSDLPSYKAVLSRLDPSQNLKNKTTNDPPSDGSNTWMVAQCTSGCTHNQFEAYVAYNFSGIPTAKLVASDETWELAYLICSPNPTIESRAVRNDGRGVLNIEPNTGSAPYRSQGNLLPTQTRLLLTYSLTDFQDKSGPSFGIGGLGTKLQASLVFGTDAVTKANTSEGLNMFTPLPLSNITEGYTRILQSATKIFLSGALGTAYVPGRISYKVVVFSSSLPHVIASTVLFIVLSAIIIWAHFRTGKGETFSLFSVAAALDRSSIPGQFSQLKSEQVDLGRPTQTREQGEELIAPWGSRVISLDRSGDGSATLHIN